MLKTIIISVLVFIVMMTAVVLYAKHSRSKCGCAKRVASSQPAKSATTVVVTGNPTVGEQTYSDPTPVSGSNTGYVQPVM